MSRLRDRLLRLENASAGIGRFIVVIGPAGLDMAKEFATRGIVSTGRDQVVSVNKPAPAAVRIMIDGVAAA